MCKQGFREIKGEQKQTVWMAIHKITLQHPTPQKRKNLVYAGEHRQLYCSPDKLWFWGGTEIGKVLYPDFNGRAPLLNSRHGVAATLNLSIFTYLNKGKLEFWPIRLRLHDLHVNVHLLQDPVTNASIHLFYLLLLFVNKPFPTSLLTSLCQVYRSFDPESARVKDLSVMHKRCTCHTCRQQILPDIYYKNHILSALAHNEES